MDKNPIEAKVSSATYATYVGTLVAYLTLVGITRNQHLVDEWLDVFRTLAIPTIPTALTFIGGYTAPHTPRPDDK